METSLLSVNYLNLCVRLYFVRFHPIFPILYVAEIKPNSDDVLLFLFMCSIGSLSWVPRLRLRKDGPYLFGFTKLYSSYSRRLCLIRGTNLCPWFKLPCCVRLLRCFR